MLLIIPPEVRQEIYTVYLTSVSNTTNESLEAHHRFTQHRVHSTKDLRCRESWKSESGKPEKCQWWDKQDNEFFESCNYYPNPVLHPATPSHSPLPLLLCNRQINAEVSSVIALVTSNSAEWMRYELGCEILHENKVFPTWFYIPPIHPKHGAPISCVYVTFRFTARGIEPLDFDHDNQREAWSPRHNGPGRMIRSLQALLTRFLKWGPNFLNMTGEPRRIYGSYSGRNTSTTIRFQFLPMNVRKLVLNFKTPSISSEEMKRREERGEIISPTKAQKIVKEYLDFLLRGGHSNNYCKQQKQFIDARVGCVQWQIDGVDLGCADI